MVRAPAARQPETASPRQPQTGLGVAATFSLADRNNNFTITDK
jgi:hypothetical protein